MRDSFIRVLSALRLLGPLRRAAGWAVRFSPARKERDRAMREFYSRFISRGDLVFDIGANDGDRTEIFRSLGARVVAADPQPVCVRTLEKRFGGVSDVSIVPSALGEAEGEAELLLSDASTISSLSREWIESVWGSGRFRAYRWDRKVTVPVTTLDRLIGERGVPAFVKIDVEGYELPVLKGLSKPVGALSFEFVPEFMLAASECVHRLESIGMSRFNYSAGESMSLALSEWVGAVEIIGILESFNDPEAWGDVYAKRV